MRIQKELKSVHCDDKMFPPSTEILREPPTKSFLESIAFQQLQPIGVSKKGRAYTLRFGRKRLLAIRQLFAEGRHDGMIDVYIFKGGTEEDYIAFSGQENTMRTDNPFSLYADMKSILLSDKKATYKTIAVILGTTANVLKALDKKLSGVPDWAVDGAVEGKIKFAALDQISKLGKSDLKEAKTIFKKNDKLTGPDVKKLRNATRDACVADLSGQLFTEEKSPRKYFTRDELELLNDLIPSSAEEAKKYAKELLAEKE